MLRGNRICLMASEIPLMVVLMEVTDQQVFRV